MGRGASEEFEGIQGLRSELPEGAWDGVEIKILCNRRSDGTVEVETWPIAYGLSATRPDKELQSGPAQPPGPLTKAKLGEQIGRVLMEEIARAMGVPYEGVEWRPRTHRRPGS